MQRCLDAGIEAILWLQQFSPALDLPFKALTLIGEEFFFLLLIPLLYWCVDKRVGTRLAILFLLSTYANVTVKALAAQPRPFTYDPRVRMLFPASGNGFPSGHTQNAVTVWGYLAACFRRRWLWILAATLMILVPLSRMYLGVHFPTDLLGGYVIGAICLLAFLYLEPRVTPWLKSLEMMAQVALAVAVSGLFALCSSSGESHAFEAAGALAGMGAGFALERRLVCFDSAGTPRQKALRLLLGLGVLAGLMAATEFGPWPDRDTPMFGLLQYALLGLWGAVGAPSVFLRLRLAQREQPT